MLFRSGAAVFIVILVFASPCLGDVLDQAFEALKKRDAKRALELVEQGSENATIRKGLSETRKRHLKLLGLLASSQQQFAEKNPPPEAVNATLKKVKAVDGSLISEDAAFLSQCATQLPRSVRPYARHWLKQARNNARTVSSVTVYLRVITSKDVKTRWLATASFAKVLAKARKKVRDGGALSEKEKNLFQSRLLINALVDQLSTGRIRADLESSPALETALSTWNATPLHALILIETPALERLELSEKAGSKRAAMAIKRIKGARARRRRRHPKSSWHRAFPINKAAPKAKKIVKKEKKP